MSEGLLGGWKLDIPKVIFYSLIKRIYIVNVRWRKHRPGVQTLINQYISVDLQYWKVQWAILPRYQFSHTSLFLTAITTGQHQDLTKKRSCSAFIPHLATCIQASGSFKVKATGAPSRWVLKSPISEQDLLEHTIANVIIGRSGQASRFKSLIVGWVQSRWTHGQTKID